MKTLRRIVTIIPAAGWRAVYRYNGTPWEQPLVCWALIELQSASYSAHAVVGMDEGGGMTTFCEDDSTFIRYAGPGEPPVEDPAEETVAGDGAATPTPDLLT